jgi:type I restriction enzyme S subunit
MSAYRPYPKYKPSGVEWLGDVPEGWEVKPLKVVASFNDDVLPESFGEDEEIEYVDIGSVSLEAGIERAETFRFGDAPSRARRRVRDGDVIASTVRTYLKAIAPVVAPPANLIVSTGFAVIRPRNGLDSHFAKFSLQSGYFVDEVISRSTGVSYPAINASEMAAISLSIPPLPEQQQIASFLDRECGKLDALQAKQERLIELLKEKRQALISHAVTRGLDPTAKLKPSGIEWLGDVPEHWRVTRLKFHVSRFEQGWSPQCEGRNKEDGEIGVLKVGCVNGGNFRVEEHKALPPELEPRLQYSLKRGDLLISRANTRELVGSAAVVDRDHDDILLCDKLYRLRFHRGVSEIYLSHFLGTSEVRQQIELDATGASASMVNIGQDCIRELNLALPPLAEQRAIVAHLDEKCGKIDQLKAKAERGIELLKERRSALISAAVTGKIDVRQS